MRFFSTSINRPGSEAAAARSESLPRVIPQQSLESAMPVWTGKPCPLGATWTGEGVNVAVYAPHATAVELCLFDGPEATQEAQRIGLAQQSHYVWHGFFPELRPGQVYGFRVDGPYDPEHGLRFNRNKVLLDPYTRAIARDVTTWDDSLYGYTLGTSDLTFDKRDSAAFAPLGTIINEAFDWKDDRRPDIPWEDTLIYECHVRGISQLHPRVAKAKRGTYAGLSSPAMIRHLKSLGVTTVELLPVHHFTKDRFLHERKLTNYWGYNSLGFFAPEMTYASANTPQGAVNEFKQMVRTLHSNDIEVILDVVYNHTGEGSELGPTICFRGLGNAAYYRLLKNGRFYENFSGCGNSWNVQDPFALQLIMDSLRYWVEEMHVDGFRFDLASVLGREPYDFDPGAAFFDAVQQDPVLSQVKLIAEPWDAVGSYDLGQFPGIWREWNGQFRDTMREFWKGDPGRLRDLGTRLCGSSDKFQHNGRSPLASINFITSHDGFTLRDLVSFNVKHNKANLENSGDDHNRSWNHGVEGHTEDPEINHLRARQQRNFLTTLFFSQGVPMLLAGDEFSRTQDGNNNVYCQDNEISWLDWDLTHEQKDFLKFTKRVIELWKQHPVFHRKTFFRHPMHGDDLDRDVHWLTPNATPMENSDWEAGYARCLGMLLDGRMMEEVDEVGEPIRGDNVLLLINAADHDIPFILPEIQNQEFWQCELDTFVPNRRRRRFDQGAAYKLRTRSLVMFVGHEKLLGRLKKKVTRRR
ncbi:MAG: glycogen debranching protein GlgX [Planctomycetota bacterium]